jgi:hypothetical protein
VREVRRLKVADLIEGYLSESDHLDPARVEHYAAILEQLRPVVVFATEDGFLLVDGYHRGGGCQTSRQ